VKVRASKRFFSDLSKIKTLETLDAAEFVFDLASTSATPEDIPGFKWLTGYPNYGRIAIGAYRIGVQVEDGTMVFRCVIHRSVVYRYFP